ncbi:MULTISPECIES: helix-turn-helix domain-containing protein [Pseudomonas]|uniref:AraC family transcriptional regulator n=1 Tax=Pseudomonas kuykendallii TaxID=1007099 RepID=A0A2W5D7V1_9PSED|nr:MULTISPECIES: AraC family transcriptional regulator [Pseudomonas]PZP25754.1 MAG: AraC family transcriptional regulator [Pseudomonas kuykendallii]
MNRILHTSLAHGETLTDHPLPGIGGLAPWQERIAKELILAHLDAGITVTRLAEACALSRSHFTRKFKESTRQSPHDWLRHQRVEKAKTLLLKSDLTLTAISMECGFFDQAHFCRVFVRMVGSTPLAWKRHGALALQQIAQITHRLRA